jgi:hypothetical protein
MTNRWKYSFIHFKIQHIYKKSRPINEAKSPYEIQQEETIENLQQELEKIMENNQPLSGKNSNDANFHTDNKDFDCSNKIAAEQRQKTIDGLNNSSDDKSSDKGNCDSVTPNNMDNINIRIAKSEAKDIHMFSGIPDSTCSISYC